MGLKLGLIDYGMGNLHSAHGALQSVAPDTQVLVTGDPEVILRADHVVLPGVGAIRDCMAEIYAQGIDAVVREVDLRRGEPEFLVIARVLLSVHMSLPKRVQRRTILR